MSQVYGYQQILHKSWIPADVKFEFKPDYNGYKIGLYSDSKEDIIRSLEHLSIDFARMAREVRNQRLDKE